jgi:hypothetical protein
LTNLVEDEEIVKILSEKELVSLFTVNSEKFGVDHVSTSEVWIHVYVYVYVNVYMYICICIHISYKSFLHP